MSNLPELILTLVNNNVLNIDEKPELLRLANVQYSIETFNLMKGLNNSDYIDEIQNIVVNLEGIQIEISLDDYNDSYKNEKVSIKIEKKKEFGLRFFFERGFEVYLSGNIALEKIERVKLDFINKSFSSHSTHFLTTFSTSSIQSLIVEDVQAIKYTKALNTESQKYLPSNTLTWISKNSKEETPESWKKWSTLKLFSSLCSELLSDSKVIEFYFRGERRKKISLDLQESKKLLSVFIEISECADWVFGQSKDIDTRHYLFNHHMTLVLSDDEKLQDITNFKKMFKDVFDNAQLAYRYHLQSSSKELTKTLTELNKTLFEYIGKIRQNAADLVNGLWRDLTMVIGLLLLNFALKKPDVLAQNYAALGFGLCLYLILSIALNMRMGLWFFKTLKKSLDEWRTKIYSYLNDTEFEDFAQKPLNEAFGKYTSTCLFVGVFYALMIGAVSKYTFWDNVYNYLYYRN